MKIDSGLVSSAFDSVYNSQAKADEADSSTFKTILEQAAEDNDTEEMKKVCQQFESIFVNMLLKQMRQTVPEGGLTEKSQARETFESMFDEEMANQIASSGGFGLGDMMYEQFVKSAALANEPINQKTELESAEQILDILDSKQ